MENNKDSMFHFVYVTDEDVKKENTELVNSISEDKKSEYVFKGEDLYYLGMGHGFVFGFFSEYITKSGVKAWQYHSGKWSIENHDYNYINNEFVLIPPSPPSEPVDFSSVQFPKVNNLGGPVALKLPTVKPI